MRIDILTTLNKKKSTKEIIITVLSEDWPLKTKEIYLKINKHYDKTLSYQAVHKILGELEEEKIIEKSGKQYKLAINWVNNSINKLSNIKSKYSKRIGKISINKSTIKPQIFKFTNYSEMCINIAELLTSRVLVNEDVKNFVCTLQFGWITFRFNFSDYILIYKMVKKNPNSINIIRTKTPFGEWIHKQYQKIDACCAPIGTKIDIDEDLFIQGDYIIEVNFSEDTKKMLNKYYNKFKNIEDVFKEFGLKNEPKMDIIVTITKNPVLAKYLRNEIEKVYNKSIK